MALMGVYDSQIAGGKRYDLATIGRRRAHATSFESHGVDKIEMQNFAFDLTPLLEDDSLTPAALIEATIGRFRDEVVKRLGVRAAR
jgi:hypothetical protein